MNLFREPSHFIVLIVLLALLFGWKKLPDMARSVGRSMRIFKSEVSEMKNDGTQAKASPAASDTVPGQTVPPSSAPTSAPSASRPHRRPRRRRPSASSATTPVPDGVGSRPPVIPSTC